MYSTYQSSELLATASIWTALETHITLHKPVPINLVAICLPQPGCNRSVTGVRLALLRFSFLISIPHLSKRHGSAPTWLQFPPSPPSEPAPT